MRAGHRPRLRTIGLDEDDRPIVPPPASVVVENGRPILYDAQGTALQRRIGFDVGSIRKHPRNATGL